MHPGDERRPLLPTGRGEAALRRVRGQDGRAT
jgi:hypothetical protein